MKTTPAKLFLRVVLISLAILVSTYAVLATYATYSAKQALQAATIEAAGQVAGNPDGKLTVVEFVDYRCHFCPTMNQTLEEAIKTETEVKVIIRPVAWVDDLSAPIAKFILATASQGKMVELHSRLMAMSTMPDLKTVKSIAASIGVDMEKAEQDAAKPDLEKTLEENSEYAVNSGFVGVPALIIGKFRYQPDDAGRKSVNGLRMRFSDALDRMQNEKEGD